METTIGRYQIKAELGRGGMAVVYRAFDPNIGREVALKLMSREFLADPEFHHRFVREARAIGALESSAIVPLYDFGEDNGQPFLVMRLMTGGSLVDKLRQGAMSVDEVSQFLSRLAEALDEAHAKGIIHRDLKPGNILLDHKGAPYLADFGIVKLLESSSMTSRGAIGTPAYMSPEHFEGEVSARSDIYALGVITFQLLTGKLPFQARTPSEWLKAHLMNTPLPLQQVNNTLPLALQPIVDRALAKNPEHRFQSAGEMARAMSTVVNQPISQSGGQRSASPPVSQSGGQRYEDKSTVINTPPAVAISPSASQHSVSRPDSQPIIKQPTQQKLGKTLPILLLIGAVFLIILLLGGIGLFFFMKSNTTPTVVEKVVTATVDPAAVVALPRDTPMPVATAINPTPTLTVEVAAETALTEIQVPGSDPILVEPPDGATINNNSDPIVLRWSGRELNAANGEQFMVFIRNSIGQNITLPDEGVTQNAEYSHGFTAGEYSWLVVVQKKNEAGNFEDVNRSNIGTFTVVNNVAVAAQPQPQIDSTPTLIMAKRPAVSLESPFIDQTFTGQVADIRFHWSESSSPLATDEYYVLIINHRNGEDRTWLKTNRYPIDDKRWLIDMGPDLRWQVVVAQKRNDDPNENPRGAERSEYSEERKFMWALPGQESKGTKDDGGSGNQPQGPTDENAD